ncbi:MAG: phytochelatin synthase family protein, partial [Polyangiales bacterium]
MRRLATLVLVLAWTSKAGASEHALVPEPLVALDTPEGEKLLAESNARVDFFRLMDSFVTQERGSYCGIASAVIVLNALPIPAPETEVGKQFTQTNFFGAETRKVYTAEAAARGGVTIDQLGDLLQTHPAKAEVVHASDITLEEMRTRFAKNLATEGDYVIVNYDRAGVGQETLGH